MTAIQNITIDHKKCVGCKVCANTCPIELFTFNDKDGVRTFTFGTLCSEQCSLCEKACTGNAIKLTPGTDKEEITFYKFEFPMIHCSVCTKTFATQKMAQKVELSLSERLKELKPTWTNLCPDCKLQKEAVQQVGTTAKLHFL